jgi:16S rRNA processing protein RimM
MTREQAGEAVQLGYIAGAHGVRGALEVKLFNPHTRSLEAGAELQIRSRGGADPQTYVVERSAPKPGSDRARLWLVGVDSRDAAEALRGHELWIARAHLPVLDEDEFYLVDLIGHEVVRARDDGGFEALGEIVGVTSNTAQDLFEVRLRGREWLLPAFAPFLVALEPERVIVDVHDDMLPSDMLRGRDGAER